jgi:hypothetical protein
VHCSVSLNMDEDSQSDERAVSRAPT